MTLEDLMELLKLTRTRDVLHELINRDREEPVRLEYV